MTAAANLEPLARRQRATGIVLWFATLASALLAGVYYSYAISVMPALARVDDRTFVTVMQQMDEAIQNPWFFASFYGAPLLTAVAVAQSRRHGTSGTTPWVATALALQVVGFAITVGANVPLNELIAAAGDPSALRARFEAPWTVWHVGRTVATTAALGCLARALQLHGQVRAPRN